MRRLLNLISIAIVLAFTLVVALSLPVFSAEVPPAPAPVDWPSITNSLIELLGAIIAAGIAALIKRVWDWLGLKNDDARRAYVLRSRTCHGEAASRNDRGRHRQPSHEALNPKGEFACGTM